MITMDLYEQKYKEALEMVRAAYYSPETPYVAKVWLLTMFPIIAENELKESADEQSKNWILDYLYDGLYKTDEQFRDEFKAAIAWLEKQGHMLNPDKVIKWLNDQACQGWIEDVQVDKFIAKFKKDFKL